MNKGVRAVSLGVVSVIVMAIIIVAGFGTFLATNLNSTEVITPYTSTSNQTTSNVTNVETSDSVMCYITGQADGLYLRVLSDSTQTPVSGAKVTATTRPATVNGTPYGNPETTTFTTSGTMWYSFTGFNTAGYSFVISYLGQNYTLTASLYPLRVTCATLFIPSGRTNITSPETYGGTCSATSTTTTSSTPTTKYAVTFQQIGACNPEFWGIPWSVTVGNLTLVQPPNTPIPISNNTLYGTTDVNYTTITFLLPDGAYSFSVSPSYHFFTPTTGTVTVAGSDVTVPITYSGTSCTVAIRTTSSTSS